MQQVPQNYGQPQQPGQQQYVQYGQQQQQQFQQQQFQQQQQFAQPVMVQQNYAQQQYAQPVQQQPQQFVQPVPQKVSVGAPQYQNNPVQVVPPMSEKDKKKKDKHIKIKKRKKRKQRGCCCCLCWLTLLIVLIVAILILIAAACDTACSATKRYYHDPLSEQYLTSDVDVIQIENSRGKIVINPTEEDVDSDILAELQTDQSKFSGTILNSCVWNDSEIQVKLSWPDPVKVANSNAISMKYETSGTGTKDKCFCRMADAYINTGNTPKADVFDIDIENTYGDVLYRTKPTATYNFGEVRFANHIGEIRVADDISAKDFTLEAESPNDVSSFLSGLLTSESIIIDEGVTVTGTTDAALVIENNSIRSDIFIMGNVVAKTIQLKSISDGTGLLYCDDKDIAQDVADCKGALISGRLGTGLVSDKENSIVIHSTARIGKVMIAGNPFRIEVQMMKKPSATELNIIVDCDRLGAGNRRVVIYNSLEVAGIDSMDLQTEIYQASATRASSFRICESGLETTTPQEDLIDCFDTVSPDSANLVCMGIKHNSSESKVYIRQRD